MDDSMKSSPDVGNDLETKTQKLTPEEREKKRKEANRIAGEKFRAAKPDYYRNRAAAIRAGTWTPRRKKAATVLPDASPCSSEPPGAS